MLKFLLKLLPADKRSMIDLALHMASSLDTPQERKEVALYGLKAFRDGKIATNEWMILGGKLGILTGPNPKKNGENGPSNSA